MLETSAQLDISSHPNFIEESFLLPQVSNHLIKNAPNFSDNPQINKPEPEDLKSAINMKGEHSHRSQPNIVALMPRSILRNNERTKTTVSKLAVLMKKDEKVNDDQKSPSLKEFNNEGPTPEHTNVSATSKKARGTRLFKGQIVENDIFQEKVLNPVIVKKTKWILFKKKVELMTENRYLELLFNLMIFYALFMDDFRTIFLPQSTDVILDSITVGCIFVFVCEICVSLITRKGYFNSFFFYLDIVSTLTMFFDLTYVYEEIFYKSPFASRFQIARASRAARIGCRAGRLVKFFNFEKFFLCLKRLHINAALRRRKKSNKRPSDSQSFQSITNVSCPINVKPSKHSLTAKIVKGSSVILESPMSAISGFVRRLSKYAAKSLSIQTAEELDEVSITKESRVGKKLSELTIKRVILITLFLILFVPVFSAEYQFQPELHVVDGVKILANMTQQNVSLDIINQTLNNFISESLTAWEPLIEITVPILQITYIWTNLNDLRKTDYDTYEYNGVFAAVDLRNYNTLDSILNIFRTVFMCVLFILGAMIFSKDANDLALRPIERMIEKVNKIANNPLKALEEGIRGTNQNMETVLIENAIIKIGTLLALGFGDAGSEIIAKNISKGNSGSVNPMIPGKKHYAIFGFCDIRNFTDVTEVLQEEVMLFVNTIASIVHRTIDKYMGNANKNIGDAFLLVWKIPDEEIKMTPDGMKLIRTKMVKSLCDLAIISYVKTIARLNSYPEILQYNNNSKINARITNYKVKMGFGLHLGWAIEGAIGSIYKIDASYLSPNVNIASRLEAATKQYGIPILISDAVWDMCSNEMRRRMRELDRVTVKGSKKPLGLFTVDLNLENLIWKGEKVKLKKDLKNHKKKKEQIMNALENDVGKCIVFIESDHTLVNVLRANYDYKSFAETFNSGLDDYFVGKWKDAKEKILLGLEMKPNDGPSLTLLNFMEGLAFEAPENWKGFRELTEK